MISHPHVLMSVTARPEVVIGEVESMLILEFEHIPAETVRSEIRRGSFELDGQIIPESLGEMLYLLVRCRLALSLERAA